ncbi:unnamed protein product, partial [Protopolystoma xenopodis]
MPTYLRGSQPPRAGLDHNSLRHLGLPSAVKVLLPAKEPSCTNTLSSRRNQTIDVIVPLEDSTKAHSDGLTLDLEAMCGSKGKLLRPNEISAHNNEPPSSGGEVRIERSRKDAKRNEWTNRLDFLFSIIGFSV